MRASKVYFPGCHYALKTGEFLWRTGAKRPLMSGIENLFLTLTRGQSYSITPFKEGGAILDKLQVVHRLAVFTDVSGPQGLFTFMFKTGLEPTLLLKTLNEVNNNIMRMWTEGREEIYRIDLAKLLKLQREEIWPRASEPRDHARRKENVEKTGKLVTALNINVLIDKGIVLARKASDAEAAAEERARQNRYLAERDLVLNGQLSFNFEE